MHGDPTWKDRYDAGIDAVKQTYKITLRLVLSLGSITDPVLVLPHKIS